ncbi:hypothetical protein Prudu_009618 [Prunus dulcis]|uniref:Uncharacterized protein n=1 Tax=Prunus dulcis TaxID=3755 RepID=A0A4Y1R6K1_PRUDU|nr:hypothetical protein Prudu_009618 [Prunus dulcis]
MSSLHVEDDTAKMKRRKKKKERREERRKKEEEKKKKRRKKMKKSMTTSCDYSNMDAPSSLKSLCRYGKRQSCLRIRSWNLKLIRRCLGGSHTFLLLKILHNLQHGRNWSYCGGCIYEHLHDFETSKNVQHGWLIDPATVSANSGTVAAEITTGSSSTSEDRREQIFMMPYNPGLIAT